MSMTDEKRVLKLTLHGAKDLAAADYTFGGLSRGKSDPYVVLRVGDQRFKSTCIASTLNPQWGNETFEFLLTEKDMYTLALEIQVFDHDLLNADDLIGTTVLALAQFEMDKETRLVDWPLDVPDEFSSQNVQSSLQVTVQVIVPSNDQTIQSELVEEMIEYESWYPIKGWTPYKMERVKELVIPTGYTSALGWVVALHEKQENGPNKLCGEGWLYATSWDGPWYKSRKNQPTAVYRKRKWTKTYMKTRATLTTEKQDETIDAILDKYGLKDDDDNQWFH
ncbi:C2 domain-containing protein [Thraustotheca clavata]|uniref:C2 domain-containing protein n=1 Tax=Thraustotheca clavata TaxID=74557 RepID=A0A1W0A293_9STRA|nr:C2 domain-containing protein [Thraustotheca clavata]